MGKITHEQIKNAFDFFYASNKIHYDAKTHCYTLDGITCAGVSSVSEFRPKDFLKFWAAKEAINYLADKQEIIKNLSATEYANLLQEAKNAHTRKSNKALITGTSAHDWAEKHIHGEDLPITKEIKNCVEAFLDFEKKHKLQWICTEKIVVNRPHLVAGRLDSLAFIDGALSLVDFKTSGQIDESYFLQTAGYTMCLEDMGIKVDRRVILRLPKDTSEFEAVEVDTPLDKDVKAFLSQRYAYEWENFVDCKHKEEVVKFYGNKKYKQKKLKLKKI